MALILLAGVICAASSEFCIYGDDTQSTDEELNLGFFRGNNSSLTWRNTLFDYQYTPCNQSGVHCDTTNTNAQLIQFAPKNICSAFVSWDNLQKSSYNDITQVWTLYYLDESYQYCVDHNNTFLDNGRQVRLRWHCNMDINSGYIKNVDEISGCEWDFYIESKWACLGQSPSTTSIIISSNTTEINYHTINDTIHSTKIIQDKDHSDSEVSLYIAYIVAGVISVLCICVMLYFWKRRVFKQNVDFMHEDTEYQNMDHFPRIV